MPCPTRNQPETTKPARPARTTKPARDARTTKPASDARTTNKTSPRPRRSHHKKPVRSDLSNKPANSLSTLHILRRGCCLRNGACGSHILSFQSVSKLSSRRHSPNAQTSSKTDARDRDQSPKRQARPTPATNSTLSLVSPVESSPAFKPATNALALKYHHN